MSAEVESKGTVEQETIKTEETVKKIDDSPVKELTEKADDTKGNEEKKEEPAAEKKEAAPPPPRVHKQDFQKDVVYLYQFCRTPVLPSLSPYCLKVETWMRLTGVQYEVSLKKTFVFFNPIFQFSVKPLAHPPCHTSN